MHLTRSDQLIHDDAGQIDRNREAISRVEPGLTRNRGVDTDDLALHVDQRAAGVTRIDGRVGLNEVGDGGLAALKPLQAASLAADDAGGDGEGELISEWIADGQHPFADPIVIAVAQRRRGEPLAGTLRTATSVSGSVPTTFASNSRRSTRRTVTFSAPSTTWLLVRI